MQDHEALGMTRSFIPGQYHLSCPSDPDPVLAPEAAARPLVLAGSEEVPVAVQTLGLHLPEKHQRDDLGDLRCPSCCFPRRLWRWSQ